MVFIPASVGIFRLPFRVKLQQIRTAGTVKLLGDRVRLPNDLPPDKLSKGRIDGEMFREGSEPLGFSHRVELNLAGGLLVGKVGIEIESANLFEFPWPGDGSMDPLALALATRVFPLFSPRTFRIPSSWSQGNIPLTWEQTVAYPYMIEVGLLDEGERFVELAFNQFNPEVPNSLTPLYSRAIELKAA